MWIELSTAVGSTVWLRKGRTHKYIRRVPKPGGGYRYYYKTSGVTRAVGADLKPGAKFKLSHQGEAGHFEVTERNGDFVTLRHDESGGTMQVSARELGDLLHREHADVVQAQRARTKQRLEAARKHGTAKQIARLEAEAKRFGVEAEPEPAEPAEHKQLRAPKRAVSPATWDRLASDVSTTADAVDILLGNEPEPEYVPRQLRVALNALQGRPRMVGALKRASPGDMKQILLSRAVVSDPAILSLFDFPTATGDRGVMFKAKAPSKAQKKLISRMKAAGWAETHDSGWDKGWTEIAPWGSTNGAILAAVADDVRGSEFYRNELFHIPPFRAMADKLRENKTPLNLRAFADKMMEFGADMIGARQGYLAGSPRLVMPD